MGRLTDSAIQAAVKAPEGRRTLWDGEGLGLRIGAKRATWITRYWSPTERRHRQVTHGAYPGLSLREARLAHARVIEKVGVADEEPADTAKAQRRAERDAPDVRQLAAEYLERWAKPRKRSWREDERILNRYVLPALGRRKAHKVRRRDIVKAVDAVGAPVMSNRVLALLRRLFAWAVEVGYLEVSPAWGTRMPAPEKRKATRLDDDQLRRLYRALRDGLITDEDGNKAPLPMTDSVRRALLTVLMTGTRPGEVAGMRWDEVEGETWTVPPGRMKMGRPHAVPLTPLVREIIGKPEGEFVFPSPRGGPIQRDAMIRALAKVRDRLGLPALTVHDLRRVCATRCSAWADRETVKALLAHVDSSVAARYDVRDRHAEVRAALEVWAETLETLAAGKPAKITALGA